MSDRYELVPLAHLCPGMVLADSLLDIHGNMLLAEGAVLGEASILSLAKHGIAAVPICRARPPRQPDPATIQGRLGHLFRRNDRDNHADWATGLLRRYVEDYASTQGGDMHPEAASPGSADILACIGTCPRCQPW